MYLVGSTFYALYFVISFPAFYRFVFLYVLAVRAVVRTRRKKRERRKKVMTEYVNP
jgi:hypothetical protein